MKSKILVVSIMAFGWLTSCKETAKEEKNTTINTPQNTSPTSLTIAKDSTNQAWKNMMESDDRKISYLKRLLDEVSYMPKYDVKTHAKLMEKVLALKNKRYDQNTMKVSENIDKYDSATDSVIREVRSFVLATPNVENYPLCNELLNDITALDNDVVMQRVRYDQWAHKYNKLTEQEGTTARNEENKKGTFQLSE